MFITEFFESREPRNLVVVYAGRFQPFHKGHQAVYNYLLKHYGRDSVYIATSNKIDPPKSPFGFTDKTYFMQMMGIPMDRVIESSQPYKATELTSNYDPENTVFLIAVSQKDMAEDPRFKVGFKKDGNPSYFQNLPTDLKNAAPMSQHGYLVVVPTFDFKVLGQPMRSATEIRAMYGEADEATRREIIQDLFGAYTQEAQHIMDSKLAGKNEGLLDPGTDTISPIHGGTVTEASPKQQASIYNPNGATYRGEKMPGTDPNDVYGKLNPGQQVNQYTNREMAAANPGEEDSIEQADRNIDLERLKNAIRASMKDLTAKETAVLNLRYWKEFTYDAIAKSLNLSVEYARQIEAKALRKLRHPSRGDALKQFVDPAFRSNQLAPATPTMEKMPAAYMKGYNDGVQSLPNRANEIGDYKSHQGWQDKNDYEGGYAAGYRNRFRRYQPKESLEECGASGYIPKNKKEAKDPRWERALSVDVHPDTMKKELKAFFPTKAPKTQQHQVTESMYFQGYQVDLDQVNKQLILSKNGTELYRGQLPAAGRPLVHEAVKKRVSAIIDKLEDDKFPDDLDVREEREPYQKAIDDLEWAFILKDREEIEYLQGLIHQRRNDPSAVDLVAAWNRKIDKLRDRIKSHLIK